jgi:demethylmenaquinone methyltransferase/2-methoxy-6-polyprenyl-1,4-benzoquinol methylase
MFNNDKESHSQEVRRMFASMATRYDLMNHLLSFGLDILWRRKAAKQCGPGNKVLDLCMGSGDMALAWLKEHRGGHVVGLDFCRQLLETARNTAGGNSSITMVEGDALQMPFPDSSFDAVMCAFGMRNLADVERGMQEVARVCRPGGFCMIVDFFRAQRWITRLFYATYGRYVIPLAGRWIGANPDGYEYLRHSVERFLSIEEFKDLMSKVGFEQIHHRHLTAAVATIVSGRRSAGA